SAVLLLGRTHHRNGDCGCEPSHQLTGCLLGGQASSFAEYRAQNPASAPPRRGFATGDSTASRAPHHLPRAGIFSPMPRVCEYTPYAGLINAQIAALLVAEFVHKSAGLYKKQQLTASFCERDARNGCGASCYGQAPLEGGSRDEAGAGK